MGKSKEIKSSNLAKKIMIYKNLILNHKVFNNISSFYNTDHLPNAFIFHGENGVGKEAHAIEFFALLNCNNPNNNQSCGICNSCSKTKKLQHENLEIIFPYPKSKSLKKEDHPLKALNNKQLEELENKFIEKGSNPYYELSFKSANTILINSIREIKKISTYQ